MKQWWSGPELAGLPGMPAQRRGVLIWGDTGRIARRPRTTGKGWEYDLASLPAETQAHLRMLAQESAPPPATESSSPTAPVGLPVAPAQPAGGPSSDTPIDMDETPAQVRERQRRARMDADEARRVRAVASAKWAALPADSEKRRRAEARQWCVRAVGELRRTAPMIGQPAGDLDLTADTPMLSRDAAARALVERLESGSLRIPDACAPYLPLHRGLRGVSVPTLLRWCGAYAREGLWGLTDGYGNRAGLSRIATDAACQRALLGAMLRDPQATGRDLHAWLHTVPGLTVPPLRTVQRFRERWIAENVQLWTLMTHPGRHKNHFQVAFGSQHEHVERLNQIWEMDSTPGDWLLTDGRHTVLGCIDLWSRRMTLRVSKTSSAWAVGQTFRSAVLGWGVPEVVRTDNGNDYVSEYFRQALEDLDVFQILCIPFASEEKGTIERALKSVCYGVAKLLPGYIGHNVAEREAIRARRTFAERIMTPDEVVEVAMSSADLQSALDRWLQHDYLQRPHAGEGMGNLAPVAKAATWRDPIRTVDARALDSLLAPLAGERTIGKKGIRWDHRWYIAPALAPYIGDPVLCRYDEADLGRLYVYRAGAFLCIAEDPDMTGISRAEVAAAARSVQKRAIREQAEELRRLKREVKENAAEAVLRHRAEQAGKLVAFPTPTEPHSTPALEAGAAAAAALAAPVAAAPTPAQVAAMARVRADLGDGTGTLASLPDSPRLRYIRWVRLHRDQLQGLPITRADFEWYDSYAESSEWRAQKRLAADFPEVYGLVGDGDNDAVTAG